MSGQKIMGMTHYSS